MGLLPARALALPTAASGPCRDDIVDADGYKVRKVHFSARFAPDDILRAQTPPPGTPYTTSLASELIHALRGILQKDLLVDPSGGTEFQLLNSISSDRGAQAAVSYTSVCIRVVPPADCEKAIGAGSQKCVDIDVIAYALRINTADLWQNLLDNARSNAPTLMSQVPRSLRALNPTGGFSYDQTYGGSVGVAFGSNLLDLPKNLAREPLRPSANRLEAEAIAQKSVENSFYNTDAGLAYSRRFSKVVDSLSAQSSFSADHTAQGTGDYLRNSVTTGFEAKFRTSLRPVSTLVFGAGYVHSSNRLNGGAGSNISRGEENGFRTRALVDGQILSGVSRLALWGDGATPDGAPGGYRRIAALFAYARDFAVRPHQAISIETLAGGGKIWGSAPEYDRFFGGNAANNFLYEASDSPLLKEFPPGPLIRSLGSGQASAGSISPTGGGSSYWHFNLNIAFPIPQWSRPLIPDITIEGIPRKDADCKKILGPADDRPLGEILKSQGSCARNTLAQQYRMQGFSADAASEKAARDLQGVNSILTFLTDRANLFSIKPMLFFDAARIHGREVVDDHARFGVGGGVQLTVVIARFEAGYVAGVHRFPGDPPGGFVMRLAFQNLF